MVATVCQSFRDFWLEREQNIRLSSPRKGLVLAIVRPERTIAQG
jgi:hypothetical protein